jgi:hypothetical protein
LFLVLIWSGVAAAQQRVTGRVIDRNGSPQPRCVVEFFSNPNEPPVYRVTANEGGHFYLDNPRYGGYTVWVRQGGRQQQVKVSINQQGLQPSTIVVNW